MVNMMVPSTLMLSLGNRANGRVSLVCLFLIGTACGGQARNRDGQCVSDCTTGGNIEGTGGAGGVQSSGGAPGGGSGGSSDTIGPGGAGGLSESDPDCDVRLPSAEQQYALWPMSTHPELGLPHPASYLSVNEGALLDEVTGLMWQVQLSESQSTAEQAVKYCEDLALGGHCDWRVPSRVEVASLMDSEQNSPVQSLLQDPDYLGLGWGLDSYWFVSLSGVFLEYKPEQGDDFGRVRCVRVQSSPPVEVHSVSIEGDDDERIVYDAGTDLTWKYSNPVVELPRDEAEGFCKSISVPGGGFRLASVKELMTIFDESRSETEHIDPAFFPLRVKYWDKVAWTTPLDVERAGWLFNFTIRSSYQLAGQVSVNSADERPVFCVK